MSEQIENDVIDAMAEKRREMIAYPLANIWRELAKAAISVLPGWQPIATAPKDGTEILAYSEHGGTGTMLVRHIALCDFLTDAEIEKLSTGGMSDADLETADWFHADFLQGGRLSSDCYPTKWMPVPAPEAQP